MIPRMILISHSSIVLSSGLHNFSLSRRALNSACLRVYLCLRSWISVSTLSNWLGDSSNFKFSLSISILKNLSTTQCHANLHANAKNLSRPANQNTRLWVRDESRRGFIINTLSLNTRKFNTLKLLHIPALLHKYKMSQKSALLH